MKIMNMAHVICRGSVRDKMSKTKCEKITFVICRGVTKQMVRCPRAKAISLSRINSLVFRPLGHRLQNVFIELWPHLSQSVSEQFDDEKQRMKDTSAE